MQVSEFEICDEKQVEVVVQYKIEKDRHKLFPWADGSLAEMHECNHKRCSNPPHGVHKHFVRFLDSMIHVRACEQVALGRVPRAAKVEIDPVTYRISLEVTSLQFYGFLRQDGEIINADGERIEP